MTTNIPDDARDVNDDPISRLVFALRAEGEHDDARIGCAVLRVYPWADTSYLVDLLMADAPSGLPTGWRRGMFAGRRAEEAVRAAGRAHVNRPT